MDASDFLLISLNVMYVLQLVGVTLMMMTNVLKLTTNKSTPEDKNE